MTRLSELYPELSIFQRRRVDRVTLRQWIEKADSGFNVNEEVELTIIKDIMQGSKGDTIVVVPRRWFIIIDFPFEKFLSKRSYVERATSIDFYFRVKVVKDFPERHFTLAKLIEARVKCHYSDNIREQEVIEQLDNITVSGIQFFKKKIKEKTYKVRKSAEIIYTPEDARVQEKIESKEFIDEDITETIDYKIVDESTLSAKLIQKGNELVSNRDKYSGSLAFMAVVNDDNNDFYLVKGEAYYNHNVSIEKIELPSEEILKELSKYYIIVIPKTLIEDSVRQSLYGDLTPIERKLYEADVYYNGAKRTITIKGLSVVPKPLVLQIRRRRYGISQYARKKLPYGKLWDFTLYSLSPEAFKEFTNECLHLYDIIKEKRMTYSDVSPREMFEDIFFIRTPKRKLKHFDEYVKIFNEVRDYAKKATLYLVFHGQKDDFERLHLPNYRAFRFSNGKITIDNAPPVQVSSITLKGGEFEKRYREVYNLDNIILFHYATTEEKIAIIREEINEVRELLQKQNISPREVKFSELIEHIKNLALSEEYPRNIILAFYQYAFNEEIQKEWTKDWSIEVKSAIERIAGLLRTGKPEDYDYEKLKSLLRVLRVATLYIMKQRGYSPMLGVIFSGNPEDIIRKILEFVTRLKGRRLALMMKLKEEEKKEEEEGKVKELFILGDRVKALLNEF